MKSKSLKISCFASKNPLFSLFLSFDREALWSSCARNFHANDKKIDLRSKKARKTNKRKKDCTLWFDFFKSEKYAEIHENSVL